MAECESFNRYRRGDGRSLSLSIFVTSCEGTMYGFSFGRLAAWPFRLDDRGGIASSGKRTIHVKPTTHVTLISNTPAGTGHNAFDHNNPNYGT